MELRRLVTSASSRPPLHDRREQATTCSTFQRPRTLPPAKRGLRNSHRQDAPHGLAAPGGQELQWVRSPGAATLACCKDTGFEGRPRLALDFFPWSQGTDLVSEPVQIDVVTDYDVPVRVAYEIVFAQDCPLRVIARLHNAHGSAALGEAVGLPDAAT